MWDDENQSNVKDKTDTVMDAEIFEPPMRVQSSVDDIPELASVVRDMPPRDIVAILEQAKLEGARLGAILDNEGEGTAAYYRWQVTDKTGKKKVVEGPTIDLMDALVHLWGRMAYTVTITREEESRVFFRVKAIDLGTIVLHGRDFSAWIAPPPGRFKGEQAERWRTMQVQSGTSKAMRGVLEHVIPAYIQHAAIQAAKTAAARARLGTKKGDKGEQVQLTLAEAIERCLQQFTEKFRIERGALERYIGAPADAWTAYSLQALRSVFGTLLQGELSPAAWVGQVNAGLTASAVTEGPEEPEVKPTGEGSALDELGLGKASGKGGGERKPRQPKAKAPEAPKAEEPRAPLPPSDDVPPADRAPLIKEARSCRDILGAEAATKAQVELGISPALTYEGMLYDDLVRLVKHMDEIIGPKEP